MVECAQTILGASLIMNFSIELEPTAISSDIEVEILLDHTLLHRSSLDKNLIRLTHDFDDPVDRLNRKIQIKFDGKNKKHTVVDTNGTIITDTALVIKKFEIENISVMDVFCSGKKCYLHNFNGTAAPIEDEFYGYIGCNGVVTFDFYCPIYLWIGDQFV